MRYVQIFCSKAILLNLDSTLQNPYQTSRQVDLCLVQIQMHSKKPEEAALAAQGWHTLWYYSSGGSFL